MIKDTILNLAQRRHDEPPKHKWYKLPPIWEKFSSYTHIANINIFE